mmetsp:Transcript_18779/g.54309  ORF Transcript_18779/g.54309 Transcript_18779/m.54309 type:complete len:264 (+) Transcript_18779:75-866(+)
MRAAGAASRGLVANQGLRSSRNPMWTLPRVLREHIGDGLIEVLPQPVLVLQQRLDEGVLGDAGVRVALGAEVQEQFPQLCRGDHLVRRRARSHEQRRQVPHMKSHVRKWLALENLKHQRQQPLLRHLPQLELRRELQARRRRRLGRWLSVLHDGGPARNRALAHLVLCGGDVSEDGLQPPLPLQEERQPAWVPRYVRPSVQARQALRGVAALEEPGHGLSQRSLPVGQQHSHRVGAAPQHEAQQSDDTSAHRDVAVRVLQFPH